MSDRTEPKPVTWYGVYNSMGHLVLTAPKRAAALGAAGRYWTGGWDFARKKQGWYIAKVHIMQAVGPATVRR